ncbi:PhzA/PhzB family protein [Streptomyces sp. H27-D2]|uniref:PhzA/PhzB family protein n=1 Tax=Streptomyces sp. H27-D2 TaxID=3046304 RepID=UPI002DBB7836|nr:PhzA/PhzB family protein [Streptomyces sp. H27-D2]MEC4019648.1 PhzA/PhzB family protein [Streptomyces sp. H27-D2]
MADDTAQAQQTERDDALRRLNRATVEKYMRTGGQARLERYTLFTEDGSGALFYTDIGQPIVVRGREKLKAHGVLSLKVLPDWLWIGVEIYDTQDPNRFWVECDGEGKILFPGYPEGIYRNHFIHSFVLDDGRIEETREYTNPIEHMRALGIETPGIKRDWIPT